MMPHQYISLTCLLFILIAMAFVSNPSSSDDNKPETDLSNIHTEDEEHIDTSMWMPTKWKKKTMTYGGISQRILMCFWSRSFPMYNHEKQNYTYEPPYA